MAIASYTTDLTTYNDCTSATGWLELSGMAASAPPAIDTDLAIHGSICISSDRAKIGLSSNVYVGAGFTLATGECVFIWHKFFAPNSLSTSALGGVRVMIGDSSSVYDGYYVDGSDTYPYGGWKNYVVDPATTPDQSSGTTTGTHAMVGNGWNLPSQAPQKGNPFGTDIIRYGRGESIFTGGELGAYATFLGYSIVNDNPTTGRFGLIQAEGTGYLYKGLMSLGTTATAVDMRDSNTSITVDNTTKVLSTFNRIEVNNASSNVEWNSISIASLSSVSKGQFEAIDNATISKNSCTFTDMDTFIYQSNSTLLSTIHRRCGLITQGGATLTGGTVDSSTSNVALTVDDLSIVTKYTFISSGIGHAIDMGTISSDITYTWDNTDSGYASTDGVTGNETILVNVASGVTLTINKAGTAGSHPTVYNTGLGTVLVVASVSIAINVKDSVGDPVAGALVYIDEDLEVAGEIVNTTTDIDGNVATSYSGGATSATIRVRKYGYKYNVGSIGLTNDSSTNVVLITDPQQI